MADPITPILAAERLAPPPDTEAESTRGVWYRYHLAHAFAAYVAFHNTLPTVGRNTEPGSRPELGYLSGMAVASTHAAALLQPDGDPWTSAGATMWHLTPELGALNGEYYDWLMDRLDEAGINPADIDHRLTAADFRSAPTGPVPAGT